MNKRQRKKFNKKNNHKLYVNINNFNHENYIETPKYYIAFDGTLFNNYNERNAYNIAH
jgi:hypothetical protein